MPALTGSAGGQVVPVDECQGASCTVLHMYERDRRQSIEAGTTPRAAVNGGKGAAAVAGSGGAGRVVSIVDPQCNQVPNGRAWPPNSSAEPCMGNATERALGPDPGLPLSFYLALGGGVARCRTARQADGAGGEQEGAARSRRAQQRPGGLQRCAAAAAGLAAPAVPAWRPHSPGMPPHHPAARRWGCSRAAGNAVQQPLWRQGAPQGGLAGPAAAPAAAPPQGRLRLGRACRAVCSWLCC